MGTLSRVLICIFVDMTRTSFLISVMLPSLLALQSSVADQHQFAGHHTTVHHSPVSNHAGTFDLGGGNGGTPSCPIYPAPESMGCRGKCRNGSCESRAGRLAADLSDQCRCCFESQSGQQGQWGAPTTCSTTPCVATTLHHTTTSRHSFNEQKSEDLLDLLQTESRADAKVQDFTC